MKKTGRKLGRILREAGVLTATQLEEALMEQLNSSRLLGEILIDKGVVNERQVLEALGAQYEIPVVEITIVPEMIDSPVLKFLPRAVMEQWRAFPLALQDGGRSLLVAVSDPSNPAIQAALSEATFLQVNFALASDRDITAALRATAVRSRSAEPASQTVPDMKTAVEAKKPSPSVSLSNTPPQAASIPESSPNPAPPPNTSSSTPLPPPPAQVARPHEGSSTSAASQRSRLGEILVQRKSITPEQLEDALRQQRLTGQRLGQILINEGTMTETRLAEALSVQLDLPLVFLTRYRAMPEAVKLFSRNVAERLQLVPLAIVEGGALFAAMADPLDILAQDEIRLITGRELKLCVTTPTEIENNLDRLYNLAGNLEDAVVEIREVEHSDERFGETEANDAPIIQLVNNILIQAVREGASDVHVEPCKNTGRVRYRVDGALYSAFDYPLTLHPALSARMKIMARIDIAEKRRPQDGRILITALGRDIDLRVSSLPTTRGEKIVLRILDQESSAVGLDKLGFERDDMEKIHTFCDTPWGIVLATGPTGSGKSTTLYSMLERINQPGVNVVTVEDPVEYSLDGVFQVHVNEKAGLTFESALRSILRQDPDKIMVGEIRDQKTAQIAIRAALTGHLVLSTLHTNDAPSALTRIVDMGIPPFLVAASLTGVIAQRLVRKLCPYCREKYELDPKTCKTFQLPVGTQAWKPVGCNDCRQGYKGRKGIYEIMMLDDDLRAMILEGASHLQLRDSAIAKGMKTLRHSGIENALAGTTSIEEVFATTLS